MVKFSHKLLGNGECVKGYEYCYLYIDKTAESLNAFGGFLINARLEDNILKTNDKLIEGTLQLIKNYASELSIGGTELEKRVIENIEDMLGLLIDLFTMQEGIIQEKHMRCLDMD